MARQINGFVGTFPTLASVTAKFPPVEYMGCSANIGTTTWNKAYCNGVEWAEIDAPAVQALVSGGGIFPLTIAAPTGTERGDTLTATPGTGWTVATYQWTRDGSNISGETSSTYTLTIADEGALIGCVAGSPVYSALLEIPAGTYPSGYLSLNGGVLSLDGGVLSLV